jgi:hypothetical protein
VTLFQVNKTEAGIGPEERLERKASALKGPREADMKTMAAVWEQGGGDPR